MLTSRLTYFNKIDQIAESVTADFSDDLPITHRILETIIELYEAAKAEQHYKTEYFETAYHAPITSDLEFFIARILAQYSKINDLEWKVFLRRQKSKTVPDLRIDKRGGVLAIIEIKAKVGWMQGFFSPDKYQLDLEKFTADRSPYNPEDDVKRTRTQLNKYQEVFGLPRENIFLLLPTLALAHRTHYRTTIPEYYTYFQKTSGLPKENFILLSENMRLDLSYRTTDLEPTDNFERMLLKLRRLGESE